MRLVALSLKYHGIPPRWFGELRHFPQKVHPTTRYFASGARNTSLTLVQIGAASDGGVNPIRVCDKIQSTFLPACLILMVKRDIFGSILWIKSMRHLKSTDFSRDSSR
jgi:hypothetical protein